MNFQNLEYFITTASERSFTRAAERLFITQQTLSGQIASLERELGHKLFLRSKPLELTDAGSVTYGHALELLKEYRKLEGDLARLRPDGDNVFSIGISFPGAIPYIGKFLGSFRRMHPGMQIMFIDMAGGELMNKLRDGSADIAIAHFSENDPSFICHHLRDEEIVIILTEDLLRSAFGADWESCLQRITAGEYSLLKDCPYVRNKRNNIVSRFADRFMETHIPAPSIVTVADTFVTQYEMCMAGSGFSLVPKAITADSLHSRDLSPLIVIPLGNAARFTLHYGYLLDSPRKDLILDFIEAGKESRDINSW